MMCWNWMNCGHLFSTRVITVLGTLASDHQSVSKESGHTAHVERWNNTLQQRLARFVRKSLSFSKSDEYHESALKLYLHEYNLRVISRLVPV